MNAQDITTPFTALFIVGMIWLRTRMQYPRGGGPLRLQPAGQIYFGAVIAVLVAGWFVAPEVGHAFWPAPDATPTLMRVIWCLVTYYVFIMIHRVLKSRGAAVFKRVAL
jgi:hypothetical protein